VIILSRSELLSSIENLRLRMHNLINEGFAYSEVLRVSQDLDKLIVKYYQLSVLAADRDEGEQFPSHLRKEHTVDSNPGEFVI